MPKLTINPIFVHGDFVYHVTDPDQCKGIVIYYEVHPKGLKYASSFNGNIESFHAFELAKFSEETLPKKQEDEEDE